MQRTLLIIGEMQIKTTIRYHFAPVRMIIKKSTNSLGWYGSVVGVLLCNQGFVGSIPSQGTNLGCVFTSGRGMARLQSLPWHRPWVW